jgi:hypothetical protein
MVQTNLCWQSMILTNNRRLVSPYFSLYTYHNNAQFVSLNMKATFAKVVERGE